MCVSDQSEPAGVFALKAGVLPMTVSPNGKSEWAWRMFTVALAALVAYYTALGAVQVDVAKVTEREAMHFQEVLRRLDALDRKMDRMVP
jgi:hypothetical protein